MDGEQPLTNQQPTNKEQLIMQLMEFGFDELYIQKAVDITLDKEKAAQIIMKLTEEGPNADLSMYTAQISEGMMIQKMVEAPLVEGSVPVTKPNRAKMLFVVNGSLKMGKGKICAQVGHAVIGAYLQIEETARFDQRSRLRLHSWENSGGAKIVVKAKDLEQILKVKEALDKLDIGINTYIVQDAGHTQIEAGSKTVMGIGPAFSDQIDSITENLKLM